MERKDKMLFKKNKKSLITYGEILCILGSRDTAVNKNNVPDLYVDYILGVGYLKIYIY